MELLSVCMCVLIRLATISLTFSCLSLHHSPITHPVTHTGVLPTLQCGAREAAYLTTLPCTLVAWRGATWTHSHPEITQNSPEIIPQELDSKHPLSRIKWDSGYPLPWRTRDNSSIHLNKVTFFPFSSYIRHFHLATCLTYSYHLKQDTKQSLTYKIRTFQTHYILQNRTLCWKPSPHIQK